MNDHKARDYKCPKCKAKRGQWCITSGNNYVAECHRARLDLVPVTEQRTRPIHEQVAGDIGIKLALWYISKVGGLKRSKIFFNAAAAALEALEDEDV